MATSHADRIAVLADIQAIINAARQMAAVAADLRKRSALLNMANAIEKRARELDEELEEAVPEPSVCWRP